MSNLLFDLQQLQDEMLEIVSSIPPEDIQQQFHPDLSPPGWHLGHCIYMESYWIRERLLEKEKLDDALKSLYVPELSAKQQRGAALPNKYEMLSWAIRMQQENNALLDQAIKNKNDHVLLKHNYLIHFLTQHYSQHIETLYMVLTERQCQRHVENTFKSKPIGSTTKKNNIHIHGGKFVVGNNDLLTPYDNEHPQNEIRLNDFNIANTPVSNQDYLQFIDDGGYNQKTHWSDAGWQWQQSLQIQHPHHWRNNNSLDWYGLNHQGPYQLERNAPVHGLSFYEAEAYVKWAGGRLPHEYEWEVACKQEVLQQYGQVWEWCANPFQPYTGFKAFPYDGYSVPYFDEQHIVLKGGSQYTKPHIKRSSFRNYYTAEKRHIFAGVRLVFD